MLASLPTSLKHLGKLKEELAIVSSVASLVTIRLPFCFKIALFGFLTALLELFVVFLTLVVVQFMRGVPPRLLSKILSFINFNISEIIANKNLIFFLGLLCLAIALIFRQIISYYYRVLMDYKRETIKLILLQKGIKEILLASPTYSLKESISRYTSTFIAEVFAISSFFSSFFGGVLFSCSAFIVYWIVITYTIGLKGGIGALLPLIILAPFFKRSSKIAEEVGVYLNAFYKRINTKLLENAVSLKIIKMLGKERDEIRVVNKDIENLLSDFIKLKKKQYKPEIWFEPTSVLVVLVLTFVGIMMGLPLSYAVLVLVGLLRMLPFLKNLANSLMVMRENMPHLVSFYNVILAAHRAREVFLISPANNKVGFPDPPVDIKLERIWFKYNDQSDQWVLKDINLRVEPGNIVAVVGRSGSGKSSLLELICGLLEPNQGEIFFGGIAASQIPPLVRRKHIAFLPQQPILFENNVLGNLLYGSTATEEDARNLLIKLGFPPDFLFKEVGEFGKELSGGERQRIAFARAVLQKTPILVLDEPTSSLDSATEKLVWQIITELKREGTTIVIATHRLNLIEQVDFVGVLEDGSLTPLK